MVHTLFKSGAEERVRLLVPKQAQTAEPPPSEPETVRGTLHRTIDTDATLAAGIGVGAAIGADIVSNSPFTWRKFAKNAMLGAGVGGVSFLTYKGMNWLAGKPQQTLVVSEVEAPLATATTLPISESPPCPTSVCTRKAKWAQAMDEKSGEEVAQAQR